MNDLELQELKRRFKPDAWEELCARPEFQAALQRSLPFAEETALEFLRPKRSHPETMTCLVCGTEFDCFESYGEENCPACDQKYLYEEGLAIVLTEEQKKLLQLPDEHTKLLRRGIVVMNDLVRQLPNSERLADYNLDAAEDWMLAATIIAGPTEENPTAPPDRSPQS